MTDHTLPREFLLAAACCRWPLSEQAIAAISTAHNDAIDWRYFLRIVKRQRVAGLVHNALLAAGIDLPSDIAQQLASSARRIAWQNAVLAAETIRLQRAFDAAQLPVVVLKGVSLAQLAYGSLSLKHSKDVDLLVPPDRAEEALQLLERDGYALRQPAEQLTDAQRHAVIQYSTEVAVRRGSLQVELRWRLTENPLLFTGVDAYSRTQDVALSDGASVRAFEEENLFAYLCVHGASHAWSRLKWLADLNALIAQKSEGDLERLYRHARATASGLCAGQALLLCHRLLQLNLPARLKDELQSNRRLEKLVAIAMDVMIGPDAETELEDRPFGSTRVSLMQFLLGEGWSYFVTQCRVLGVRLGDVVRYPLPSSLHFLYPILRVLLWLRRRGISGGAIHRNRQNRPKPRP